MTVFSSYWSQQVGKGIKLQVELVAVPKVLLVVVRKYKDGWQVFMPQQLSSDVIMESFSLYNKYYHFCFVFPRTLTSLNMCYIYKCAIFTSIVGTVMKGRVDEPTQVLIWS